MHLAIIQRQNSSYADEFAENSSAKNLLYYASEAATEMEFDSLQELHAAVKTAMELCLAAGIPIKGNFLRIYKSFGGELTYDWKLSVLAYKLVCVKGSPTNPNVARLIIQLIKEQHLKHF
jgi:uncharacterized protein YqgV (UPF0045/DUF77 family)